MSEEIEDVLPKTLNDVLNGKLSQKELTKILIEELKNVRADLNVVNNGLSKLVEDVDNCERGVRINSEVLNAVNGKLLKLVSYFIEEHIQKPKPKTIEKGAKELRKPATPVPRTPQPTYKWEFRPCDKEKYPGSDADEYAYVNGAPSHVIKMARENATVDGWCYFISRSGKYIYRRYT